MSNMIFVASLILGWSSIVEILKLRERAKSIGDGTIDGYRYTLVQREDQIYVELPNYPREKCEEIIRKLLQKLRPDAEIKLTTLGYVSSHCNYCLTPGGMLHKCHRCGGWYCNEHRLPEQHNCPEDRAAKTSEATARRKPRREKAKEEKELVVVSRVPCG